VNDVCIKSLLVSDSSSFAAFASEDVRLKNDGATGLAVVVGLGVVVCAGRFDDGNPEMRGAFPRFLSTMALKPLTGSEK
jgi:hypothetical protein